MYDNSKYKKTQQNRGAENRIFVFSCISRSVSKICEQGELEPCEEAAILKDLRGKHFSVHLS